MEKGVYGDELRTARTPRDAGDPRGQAHRRAGAHLIEDWRPEEKEFWDATGRAIARRDLLISISALLPSFAVWMVWSVVVAKLPSIGFTYSTDDRPAVLAGRFPALSGATLRIFYSFMVPIFGGRLWTAVTTWSLIIPALGIGMATRSAEPLDPLQFALVGER
jgi:NNP family nitrate/nitrite transporter-like MFS transporter